MSIARKFVTILVVSICSIAILNVFAFYFFYNSYIRLYLSDKIESREDVTIEYINNIIERQALENIDSIFDDVELEFFELLDISDGTISLQEEENVNIVVDYLRKSNVSPKYIEEIIPENNLEKVLASLKDPESPESGFIKRLSASIIVTNIIILLLMVGVVLLFTSRIIIPIKRATNQIKTLTLWKNYKEIEYKKKDEVGLLIEAINKLNESLSVQEKIRSRLLADISHELKTPITSIQCYLEWISDGVIKLTNKNLESITSEMTRLIELVNKIMEYEKFENTELELKKSVENPFDLISRLVETQKAYLKDKKQEVEVSGTQNIEIFVDKDLFTQLVYNLIGNFIKYAWKGTKLDISVWATKIVFSDNGAGIAKKEIPFLFEKFYQWKKEKTWDISMRWIGVWLSIVKKIVDAHGWDIQIKSDTKKWFSFSIIF